MMSQPMWLMMGTAFKVHETASRTWLVTAKHTFSPWDYTKDKDQLMIPEEYRRLRYVTCRVYGTSTKAKVTDEGSSSSSPTLVCATTDHVSAHLSCTHPDEDVALLWVARDASASLLPLMESSPCVKLSDAACSRLDGAAGRIEGYRGMGRLGELDTLDASLLSTLPSHEREALLKDLENVEGKQCRVTSAVRIVDMEKGVCQGVDPCYHGMSGSPLLVEGNGSSAVVAAGVLSGKHAQLSPLLAFVPSSKIESWLGTVSLS